MDLKKKEGEKTSQPAATSAGDNKQTKTAKSALELLEEDDEFEVRC